MFHWLRARIPDFALDIEGAPPTQAEIEAVLLAAEAEERRLQRLYDWSTWLIRAVLGALVAATMYIMSDSIIAGVIAGIVVAACPVGFAIVFAGIVISVSLVDFNAVVPAPLSVVFVAVSIVTLNTAVIIGVVIIRGMLAARQYSLEEIKSCLQPADQQACVNILAWCGDPVIEQYRLAVATQQRRFVRGEVEAMRAWVEGAEKRREEAERQAQIEAAYRQVYEIS